MRTVGHLFFDLDGTLTHSHEGITRCIQHALAEAGIDPPATDALRRFIGPPLRDSFAALLGTNDPVRLNAAIKAYRARFQRVGMFENQVCPGIPDALESFSAEGLHLSVVTAKPAVFARRILDHFELSRFFLKTREPDELKICVAIAVYHSGPA